MHYLSKLLLRSLLSILPVLFCVGSGQSEEAYQRGIWYDIGSGYKNISPYPLEVDKLYKQGVRRIHIFVNEDIRQKSIGCPCTHTDAVTYFMYHHLPETDKISVSSTYRACVDREAKSNKFCAFAKNYQFEFDKWGRFKRLISFIKELNRRGIEIIFDVWPSPTPQYIASLKNLVNNVTVQKLNIYGIELEDEENWTEVFTQTGTQSDLDRSSDEILSTLRKGLPRRIRIGVTTAARGFDDKSFARDKLITSPLVDFISFQAYQDSFAKGRCIKSNLTGDFSPQKMTDRAIDLILKNKLLREKDIIFGLSAYQMDCPQIPRQAGITGVLNMYKAAKELVCKSTGNGPDDRPLKLIGEAYFSEANVVGQRANHNPYAHDFLSLCRLDSLSSCEDRTRSIMTSSDGASSNLDADCPGVIYSILNKIDVKPGLGAQNSSDVYVTRKKKGN